jgi:hypothetical protein
LARLTGTAAVLGCLVLAGGAQGKEITLSDAEIENLVRRSYQYVAMYNVNNKFALKQGGWGIAGVGITGVRAQFLLILG